MSDVIGPIEVERDVDSGEHIVAIYAEGRTELTPEEAEALADALRHHAEPAECWRCEKPSMPGDLCPRCQDDDDERRTA